MPPVTQIPSGTARLAPSVLLTGLLLVACAQPEPLRGIDLPPASLPAEIDSTQWAVSFSHEFGPAFWEEGPHVYQLLLDCPEIGEASVEGEFIAFAAGGDFPTLESTVHLRLSGLSTTTMGPPDLQFVSNSRRRPLFSPQSVSAPTRWRPPKGVWARSGGMMANRQTSSRASHSAPDR